ATDIAVPIKDYMSVCPESAVVEGRVIDSATQAAVPFAYLALEAEFDDKLSHTAIADSVGKFAFSGVKQGKYKLQITMLGYKSLLLSNINVAENATLNLNVVALLPTSTQLKETEITAEKPYI